MTTFRSVEGTVGWVKPHAACIVTESGPFVVMLPDLVPGEFCAVQLGLLARLGKRVWCWCEVNAAGVFLRILADGLVGVWPIEPERPRYLRALN